MHRIVAALLAACTLWVPLLAKGDVASKASDFFHKLQGYARLASQLAGLLKEYPHKLAELRAKRAAPPPFALGHDPAKYKTAAGALELFQKAELLAGTTRKYVQDKLLITGTDLHPDTFEILRYFNGVGDAGAHHGMYLAALAYRYGVTGDAAHLAELLDKVHGAYNQLTITSAPDGVITDPRTGQRLAPRPGLPVRGYASATDPLTKDMNDIAVTNNSVYRYEGSLSGLPKGVWHFNSDISRDEMDGIFFGLGAVWEVLTKRNVEPAWRTRIGAAMAQSMRDLVSHGYKFIEMNGKMTEWGDESSFARDPTMPVNVLSWFTTAVRMSGDAALRAEMNRFADKYFGKARALKASLFAGVLSSVGSLLRRFPELIGYMLNSYNHHLMAMYIHNLVRDAPDAGLRGVGLDFLHGMAWPLAEQARVPFFDYVFMNATARRDPALLDRALGVLGQVRAAAFPRGNPVSRSELVSSGPSRGQYVTDFHGRTELHDPLYFMLKSRWEEIRKLLPGNPEGPLSYGGSAWPLGPGLVPKSNFIERASAYDLVGAEPYAWSWTGDRKNLRGYPAHDYLLSYWFGRYHGLLSPAVTAGAGLALSRQQALGTVARLVVGLQNKVQSILARAKAWVVGLAHRLEPQARCVAQHVRPLAAKLATELHAEAAAYARAFWSELGPSLGTLSLADRHTVVDAPWSTFAAAVGARFGEARQSGHNTIGGWFGRARNRDEARAVFDATFDADAARLSAELKQGYDAAMR